jgi:hypothetical protein
MSAPGTFDDGDDVVWTFARERTPGGGCETKFPGSQFVAVGTADRVDQMSKGTTKVMGVERWWAPYATVDIDGDGTDEVVVAHDYPGAAWAIQIWLYRQAGGTVEPVWASCGNGCKYAWNTALGKGLEETGVSTLSGVYCGSIPTAPDLGSGIVLWQISRAEPTRMFATVYRLERNGFLTGRDAWTSVSGPVQYPPTGERSACGSQIHQPPAL